MFYFLYERCRLKANRSESVTAELQNFVEYKVK